MPSTAADRARLWKKASSYEIMTKLWLSEDLDEVPTAWFPAIENDEKWKLHYSARVFADKDDDEDEDDFS